nr:hypothetical protein [Sedimentibacter sp.]
MIKMHLDQMKMQQILKKCSLRFENAWKMNDDVKNEKNRIVNHKMYKTNRLKVVC